MSKNTHILCVAAGTGDGRYAPRVGFHTMTGSLAEAIAGDLWIGPRPHLETLRPLPSVRDPLSLLEAVTASFSGDGRSEFADLLSSAAGLFREQDDAVEYPAYLQIIPYYLFRNGGRYFNYVRPQKGSESRLHGKVSIGIGGHVDLKDMVPDADGRIDLAGTLEIAGKREAHEEIGIDIPDHAFRFIGTIYATDTEVDRLHFGIVGVCDLTDEQVASLAPNEEIEAAGFQTLTVIRAEAAADPHKTLETWTRLVIDSNPLA